MIPYTCMKFKTRKLICDIRTAFFFFFFFWVGRQTVVTTRGQKGSSKCQGSGVFYTCTVTICVLFCTLYFKKLLKGKKKEKPTCRVIFIYLPNSQII